MKHCVAITAITAAILVSCGRPSTGPDYMAIHKDGMRKLDASRQINARYADVDNFIVQFGSEKQPMEWQTVAFIEGRFVLTYIQPVTVDYSNRTLTPAGAPKFLLQAAESISIPAGGTPQTTYDSDLQREFGEREWKEFVAAGFDLTSLGIPTNRVHPVPLWKEYVAAWRKDRIPVK